MENPVLLTLPEALVGERTLVRPWRAGDGAALFEAVEESREHIRPWLPWGPSHGCPEDSEILVRTWRANWDLRKDLSVSLWDRETGRFVGGSGLHRIDWRLRAFEIGYWIRKSAEGRGHVTEAARLLTEMAFETLDANRVLIRCATTNARSLAIPPRLGFEREGTLRNAGMDSEGRLYDVAVFGKTPSFGG